MSIFLIPHHMQVFVLEHLLFLVAAFIAVLFETDGQSYRSLKTLSLLSFLTSVSMLRSAWREDLLLYLWCRRSAIR